MNAIASYAAKFPLVGPFWAWAGSDLDRFLVVMGTLGMSTLVLLAILWTNGEVDGSHSKIDYIFFREPTLGLTGDQVRGILTFPPALPLTVHLAPLLLAGMLVYHLVRASACLGRMAVGAKGKTG